MVDVLNKEGSSEWYSQEYSLNQNLIAMNNLMFLGRLYGLRGSILKAR